MIAIAKSPDTLKATEPTHATARHNHILGATEKLLRFNNPKRFFRARVTKHHTHYNKHETNLTLGQLVVVAAAAEIAVKSSNDIATNPHKKGIEAIKRPLAFS